MNDNEISTLSPTLCNTRLNTDSHRIASGQRDMTPRTTGTFTSSDITVGNWYCTVSGGARAIAIPANTSNKSEDNIVQGIDNGSWLELVVASSP